MEREQIVKALECFTSVADLTDWTPSNCVGCYFETQGLCEQNCSSRLADVTLALIRELTEENKRLKEQNAYLVKEAVFSPMERAHNTIAIKADTVRKMAEWFRKEFLPYTPYVPAEINAKIDRITKEMLKGEGK